MRFLISGLQVFLGIFTILATQMPSKTGIIGQTYYTSVLNPLFGSGAGLFSAFIFLSALVILLSARFMSRLVENFSAPDLINFIAR